MGEKTKEEFEDVAELKAILGVISEFLDKLPKLINELMSTLYAADLGERLGKSIGEYYKKLKESGIPEEVAIRLTESYAKETQTPMKLLSELISGIGGRRELDIERLRRIKETVESKFKETGEERN
ncbi:MAG: hypothetical protein N3E39_01050 [Candidatus Methanomethylicia archaeon]|nr:hypothetical protein [Candidatus Methanomethylicia archaeon]MDW7988535.1 hypothetical protein [Nitrososphaerota archaeon]